MYVVKIGACIVTPRQSYWIREVLHVTDHLECGLRLFILCPSLKFLQGSYFSTEGALGLPKAKSW